MPTPFIQQIFIGRSTFDLITNLKMNGFVTFSLKMKQQQTPTRFAKHSIRNGTNEISGEKMCAHYQGARSLELHFENVFSLTFHSDSVSFRLIKILL